MNADSEYLSTYTSSDDDDSDIFTNSNDIKNIKMNNHDIHTNVIRSDNNINKFSIHSTVKLELKTESKRESQMELKREIKTESKTNNTKKMKQCQYCSKQFPSNFHLKRHSRIHTGL